MIKTDLGHFKELATKNGNLTPENFVYWLQGFVEMNGGKRPTKEQWKMINDHLQLVFLKIDHNVKPQIPAHKGYLQPIYDNKFYCTNTDQEADLKIDTYQSGNIGGNIIIDMALNSNDGYPVFICNSSVVNKQSRNYKNKTALKIVK